MQCPACREEMLVLEFEQIELDYCPACAGAWLDSGELELIGERAGALRSDLLAALATAQGPRSKPRRCPICRKTMRRVCPPERPDIEVDRCPLGDGLWFDRGEMDSVVRAAEAPQDNPLARFFAALAGECRKEAQGS